MTREAAGKETPKEAGLPSPARPGGAPPGGAPPGSRPPGGAPPGSGPPIKHPGVGLGAPRPRTRVEVTSLAPTTLVDQIEDEQEESLPLAKVLRLLVARRWLIVSVTAVVLVAAMLQVVTTTPLYRSMAQVELDPEAPNLLPGESVADLSLSTRGREEYMATQARKLQTRVLARRVIDRLDLGSRPAFVEEVAEGFFVDRLRDVLALVRRLTGGGAGPLDDRVLVDRFLEQLGVQVVRNTRLIEVSFTSPDPDLAALVVNTVVDEFIAQSLEDRFAASNTVTDFLRDQLRDLKTTVESSEQELLEYAHDNDIVSLNERDSLDLEKLSDLTDELTRVEAELLDRQARYEVVRRATIENFPLELADGAIRKLDEELSGLRRQLAGLASRYGSEWPEVKQIEREIREVEGQLRSAKGEVLANARRDYEVALDRHRRLSEAASSQRRVVDQLNRDSIEYGILERETVSNQELYEGLLQRLKEAGVAAGLTWSNINLADAAEVPRRPAYPRRGLALAVSLVLGLFLGIGGAVIVEALDDTFNSAEEVSQVLRLPALGIIPVLVDAETHGERGGERSREGRGGRRSQRGEEALVVRRRGPAPIIAWAHARSLQDPSWEAYRSLRTSLLLSHSGKPPQTILVTSALPGEGKSTTVANTAIVLTQTGARTLVLDLDMRKPTMADLFGVSSKQGMSTYLTGNSDLSPLVQESGFPNLYLVPAGPPAPNPAELVGSERMRSGLSLLLDYFEYIVIDSPPCLEITDALVLAPAVDGLLMVVRGGKTPRQLVRKASDRLLRVGGKILGVLVNAVDLRRSEYGYYHGYYNHYYRSGDDRRSRRRVRKSA